MSKVRVQDATKELSSSVGQLYETVSKSRKRALEALNSLKKLEESARQKERELKAQEEAKKRQDGLPAVFHRKDGTEWLVTMTLSDWIDLFGAWNDGR